MHPTTVTGRPARRQKIRQYRSPTNTPHRRRADLPSESTVREFPTRGADDSRTRDMARHESRAFEFLTGIARPSPLILDLTGWPSSLLKFDRYVRKELFLGYGKYRKYKTNRL